LMYVECESGGQVALLIDCFHSYALGYRNIGVRLLA
jgi:hypothetical protein